MNNEQRKRGRHKIDPGQRRRLVPLYLKEVEVEGVGGIEKCIEHLHACFIKELVRLQIEKEKTI